MNKNSCPFKVGTSAVYLAPNGDSLSVTITHADKSCVYVKWYPAYMQEHTAMVLKADWNRLTPFGDAKFLAV